MQNKKLKAVCFDWGNTIEVGSPKVVETLLHVWQNLIEGVSVRTVTEALQDAWIELAKLIPTAKDRKDMTEFRQMIYARQAEMVAAKLEITPDIPDWPWVFNVFFNEHYYKNRSWTIPRSHARLLRKLRAAGVPMAVVANNDDPVELPKLISDLGLTGFFEFELASSSFGYGKPHEELYLSVLNKLDLRADDVLYVGDDYHNDYWGPSQVDMFPVLYDPKKLYCKIPSVRRIERLEEIADIILPE